MISICMSKIWNIFTISNNFKKKYFYSFTTVSFPLLLPVCNIDVLFQVGFSELFLTFAD